MNKDTIVALATPFGRSGIGVIRLSGSRVLEIIRRLTRDEKFSPVPRSAVLKKIFSPHDGELTDEVIITYFQSPQSFTGEDVIEISCHGAPVLIRQIIDYCLQSNARLAEAGEFSLRALSNGRMNLSQAEAIRDLIDSQTVSSAKQSIRQLQGELSNSLQPLKDKLLNVIVVLESALEFVEDDLPEVETENIKIQLLDISNEIARIASTFRAGKLLRTGLKVALVGRPNVGKSSLFNILIGHNRAIVTDIAGTTRDSLHESLTINDVPVFLTDTAGLRDTSDTVESIGVERTKRLMADSDLVVAVFDGSQALTYEDNELIDSLTDYNYLVAVNKTDLNGQQEHFSNALGKENIVHISAKTGFGIQKLQESIVERFLPQDIDSKGFLISDARHFDLLNRAKNEIDNSRLLLVKNASEEITLIGLHNAIRFLGDITGETTAEDILSGIFSTFCVGK